MKTLKDIYKAKYDIGHLNNIDELCSLIKCDNVINNGDRTIRITHSSDPMDAIINGLKIWCDVGQCIDHTVITKFKLDDNNTLIRV